MALLASPLLTRLRTFFSSFAPPAPSLRHLLSFGDRSYDDQPTAPEHDVDAAQQHLPPPATDEQPRTSPDIELDPQNTTGTEALTDGADAEAESVRAEVKRVGKMVQPICWAVAAGAIALFFNMPPVVPSHLELVYQALLACICLGFFTSSGLCVYSIIKPGDCLEAADTKKKAMLAAIGFLLVAFVLRIFLAVIPFFTLEYVWLVFFLAVGVAVMYVLLSGTCRERQP